MSTHSNKTDSFLKNFLAGGISSAVSKTAVAPVERVKLLLQVQRGSAQITSEVRYKGIIDAFRRIPKEQGFLSFYRGNLVNVVRYVPEQAINFAFKDKYQQMFVGSVNKSTNFWTYFTGNMLAGGAAGATSICLLHPLDFGRTRLATDIGKTIADREFTGLKHCMVKIFKSDGILGLYRGFYSSLLCMTVYRAMYFGFFDTTKDVLSSHKIKPSLTTKFLIAQTVATMSGLIAYPLDTIRRRMMLQSGVAVEKRKYNSAIDCFWKILKHETYRGFFSGALSNVYKSTGGAILLIMYDEIKTHLF